MEEKILKLIEDYKDHLRQQGNKEEVYKWQAIIHFQNHWDFKSSNFYSMFKDALSRRENLMFQNSYGFLDKLGKTFPDKLKRLFAIILNNNSSFNAIYDRSRQFADQCLEDLKQALNRDNLSHQLDERTISFLRVLNNPEEDYLYKANVYEALCDYLDIQKVTVAGQKYNHFVELADSILPFIENDEALLKLCNDYIPEDFHFNSAKLILQDMVYNMLVSLPSSKDHAKFLSRLFNDIKEELENEAHPLINHQWIDNESETYRQVSIIPDTSKVPVFKIHYELYKYASSNKICFEVHPEGDRDFKRLIKTFINEFPNSDNDLKLSKWHTGIGDRNIDKGEHFKLIPKQKTDYSLKVDHYDTIKRSLLNQFKSLYDSFNMPFLKFIDMTDNIEMDVKAEFINWLINKPKSNYFFNDKDTLNRYLDNYNTYFDIDIFKVSKSNYKDVINIIDKEAYQDTNSAFFLFSDRESTHRPRAILGRTNYFQFLEEKFNKKSNAIDDDKEYKAPLNQILYGPPGTGKTYHTVLEAAKIVTNNKDITYEDALQVFNNQLGKQIAFITFHQNYSYEDFIQGLRPDTETNGDLSFYKKDGVFKVIADKALNNIKAAKHPEAAKLDFETVFNRLIQPLKDEDQNELEIPMKRASFFITEVGEKSIEFRKNQGDSKHTLSISTLKKMYDKEENNIILGGLQPYYNPILQLLLEQGKRQVEQVPLKNYVIIIDEINRANISRVFGELITLIEKDKRSHGNIPLSVTLPSGDVFTVPSNLYIIGTMNTADKSIALLDIALRRRFEFVPMYPKYQIEGKTIHKSEFLRQLNDLIVKSGKGQDFTIGHAYFMCDDHDTFDFETTLNNKVIPLLLEYFMNDVEEVTKLLNQAGVTVGDWPLRVLPND